jgi:hypothetical protein
MEKRNIIDQSCTPGLEKEAEVDMYKDAAKMFDGTACIIVDDNPVEIIKEK